MSDPDHAARECGVVRTFTLKQERQAEHSPPERILKLGRDMALMHREQRLHLSRLLLLEEDPLHPRVEHRLLVTEDLLLPLQPLQVGLVEEEPVVVDLRLLGVRSTSVF